MKKVLLLGAALFAMSSAYAVDYYMIGSNVNGNSWALAMEDAKFVDQGNGVYRWEGKELGTGWKMNDGTWSNDDINFGSNGSDIQIGVPYFYGVGGSSGDIAFDGFTVLTNPVVELNINDGSVTIVGGSTSGTADWYATGFNGAFNLDENEILSPVAGSDTKFSRVVTITQITGECKISTTGWAHKYGTDFPDEVYLNAETLGEDLELNEVYGEAGNIPYELEEGNYVVVFDAELLTMTVTNAADGVTTVLMGADKDAVYYNLHGVRVANPDKGIYVKVANGKAVKVVR